jgi:nucleoid-associated protein YgaU
MDSKGLKRGRTGFAFINKKIPTTGTAVCGVQSAGTLTIAEPVSANDTITIGGRVYTFKITAEAIAAGHISLGTGEVQTKANICAAILGTDGRNARHEQVSCPAAFTGDTLVITAREAGAAGDAIATTETLTHISNVFDGVTLGTTAAGVDTSHIGEAGDQLIDDSYLYICVKTGNVGGNWRRIALGNAY